MRFSRHCYDKPWRCPGWNGGGMRFAKAERCSGGRLQDPDDWGGGWRTNIRFHRCNTCDVVASPMAVQWFDPRWVWFQLRWWWRDWRYWHTRSAVPPESPEESR